MLSKKRQIMFEVMGRRAQQVSAPEPVRVKKKARRPRMALPSFPSLPSLRAGTWWFALSGVVLLSVVFVVWRVQRAGGPRVPVLQANTEQPASPEGTVEPVSSHTFAVCAMSRDYRTRTEHKLAADKIQETVDFLGYHSDPDFRDVRGQHYPGKDLGSGTYRVYVGSAKSRSELVPLKDKLAALVWNRGRPFQNSTVKLVETAVAAPGSKEVAR